MGTRASLFASILLVAAAGGAACSSKGGGAGRAQDEGRVDKRPRPEKRHAREAAPAPARVPRAAPSRRTVATEVDLDLPRPDHAWWIGATEREVLLRVGSFRDGVSYFAVVELETGCVVGTHSDFDAVWDGPDVAVVSENGVATPASQRRHQPASERMGSDAFRKQLAEIVELVSDFSARGLRGWMSWSADRRKVLFAGGDWMYRSRDGGRTFTRIDRLPAYDPEVSADGRFGVYRRCHKQRGCVYRPTIVPLDSDGPPAWIGRGEAHDVHFDPSGDHVYFAREDEATRQLCVDRSDTKTRRSQTLGCVESDVNSSSLFFVSPGLRFGVLDVLDDKALQHGKILWSLADGRQLRTVPDADGIIPPVDDRGAFAWSQGISPDYTAHVSTRSADITVGPGDPLGWDPRGRLIVATEEVRAPILGRLPGTLRSQKCGYVAAIDVDLPSGAINPLETGGVPGRGTTDRTSGRQSE
jgi:hypothetical protein